MRLPAWSLDEFFIKNARRFFLLGGIAVWMAWAFGPGAILGAVSELIAAAPLLAIQLVFAMFFMIVQFGALMWFMSRPRTYTVKPDDAQIALSFEDYRGQPDLLAHAKSTVRILQGATAFEGRGGTMPKGMLMSGSPGTGKTFLASVIAAEAGLPFVYVDASSLRGMFWGMDTMMVIKLFRDARGLARRYAQKGKRGACLLFIDELDSIGLARGGSTSAGGVGGMMFGGGGSGLNTLLNQMDGAGDHVEDRLSRRILRSLGILQGPLAPKPIVFVIGATNRPEVLDTALTRPGRLDRLIKVYEPDGNGRRDIIKHYLNKVAHEQMELDLMVSDSVGWTPIAIKTTINEALIIAHDDGREQMTYRDWLAAADQRSLGLKQPIENMHEEDREALAYHEAGHAVVAYFADPKNHLRKATIIRSGDALGAVSRMPLEERHTTFAGDIIASIAVSLGSRAVEETLLKGKMTGASSDLQNATQLALAYCGRFGMGSSLLVQDDKAVAKMADELLDKVYDQTIDLVRAKSKHVHALAKALIERHELIGPDLIEVLDSVEPFHRWNRLIPPTLSKPKDEPK